ncbi:ubiquinone/menaquinone biosynthesis methyltransferase [Candidatus Comchoanobacter bicostacola]|uniref:Ubiquinone/menaquinone biosynthesis C-methyltransferase UbiE n=1 Tax=Candidatus Comchoanobacter bicostacola TaxID=2919598 RepID=A0ABY5DKP1_9GAMM|nr:ubiquinone/menaquinone biosynthesis methyltransferase [Candidatus Comchoanobacter bicostacola]UTC24839.1 ubiquinone/menaquinone biosynthesis methyltransferase [Candidatus Comchoanobacter bicostacola]
MTDIDLLDDNTKKTKYVNNIFSNVSSYYRLMNNCMSLGSHHLWRKNAVIALDPSPGDHILDLACGTGDASELILPLISTAGSILCADPCTAMLDECKKRINDPRVSYLCTPGESLPTLDPQPNRAIICFGIRNFSNPMQALQRIYQNLTTTGKIVILEFNPPSASSVEYTYQKYLNIMLPKIGRMVANDAESYTYLSDSIQQEPSPDERMALLSSCGFESISYQSLSFGIVGIFEAYKYT